jgi:hypothetical protein
VHQIYNKVTEKIIINVGVMTISNSSDSVTSTSTAGKLTNQLDIELKVIYLLHITFLKPFNI